MFQADVGDRQQNEEHAGEIIPFMNIGILGSGFIAQCYVQTLQGHRSKDKVVSIYSRTEKSAKKFAHDFKVESWTTNLEEAVSHPKVDIVCILLPNHLHEDAVMLCCKYKKPVMITKPLGRTLSEARRMLLAVEKAGIFNGYLEDLVYTPKFLKAREAIENGSLGRILWAKSRDAHSGPHSEWFFNTREAGGGCILDLGSHCFEAVRHYVGRNVKPIEVMCWAGTQVKKMEAEDHAIALIKFENGAMGQFEVGWCFPPSGLDLRDEILGTEGTIWVNNFQRTGLEVFSSVNHDPVSKKSSGKKAWTFPVGDEFNTLGHPNMFSDMLNSLEKGKQPKETFYDGYIVNSVLDAAYRSAKSKKWERIKLDLWNKN